MRHQLLLAFCAVCSITIAQPVQRDAIAKPLSDKEKKKRDQKLNTDLESPYKAWEDWT